MFNTGQNKDSGNHEINMTPLIDVSLVLVVMLLLATPLAFESTIGVRGAQANARQATEKKPVDRIEIVLVSDDAVRVNGRKLARADLSSVLPEMIAKSSEHSVLVGCEKNVTHGAFVNVLDQAKMSGAAQIAVYER